MSHSDQESLIQYFNRMIDLLQQEKYNDIVNIQDESDFVSGQPYRTRKITFSFIDNLIHD